MTKRASRKFGRKLNAILLPALFIALGLGWIVADGYRLRSKHSDKYALPTDHSAASMLTFLRKLDGDYDPRSSLISQSNLPAINKAVRQATQILDQDRTSLTPVQQREADYYRLRFGYSSIVTGGRIEDDREWNDLLAKTRHYVTEATLVSNKEITIAGYALSSLDVFGRSSEAIQLADLIADKFSSLPDGEHKSMILSAVARIRQRLQLLGSEIELTTNTLDGVPISVRDLRGKVVLVEFWSTTCGPCLADFPALKRIYRTYHDAGFEVLGICLYASAARIESCAKQLELPWIQVCHDPIEGNDEWATQFGIQAVPTTMLIDQSGKVIRFGVRPLHSDKQLDLEENLKVTLSCE